MSEAIATAPREKEKKEASRSERIGAALAKARRAAWLGLLAILVSFGLGFGQVILGILPLMVAAWLVWERKAAPALLVMGVAALIGSVVAFGILIQQVDEPLLPLLAVAILAGTVALRHGIHWTAVAVPFVLWSLANLAISFEGYGWVMNAADFLLGGTVVRVVTLCVGVVLVLSLVGLGVASVKNWRGLTAIFAGALLALFAVDMFLFASPFYTDGSTAGGTSYMGEPANSPDSDYRPDGHDFLTQLLRLVALGGTMWLYRYKVIQEKEEQDESEG